MSRVPILSTVLLFILRNGYGYCILISDMAKTTKTSKTIKRKAPMASRTSKSKRSKYYPKNTRFVQLIGVLIIAALGTILLKAIFAAPGATSIATSLYATHPYASKAGFNSTSVNYYTGQKLCATTFCPTGQLITDMEITDNGQLIAGYGDWNANVDSFGVPEGRVGIVPLDLNTNVWGPITVAGSEALDTIRKINGKIYAPTTDPSDTLGSKSGYVTNESGAWELKVDNQGAVHLFDVATLNGTDRWETGSASDGAAAFRSVSNNGSWAREPRTVAGGYARYYWAAALNGKMYVGGAEKAVFDGSTWSTASTVPCGTNEAKNVTVYEGLIYCAYGSSLYSFDGTTATTLITLTGQIQISRYVSQTEGVKDLTIGSDGLYVLTDLGNIYRIQSSTHTVTLLGAVTTGANTLAYYGGYLYFGYDGGKIYRTNNTLGGSTAPAPGGVMAASATTPNTMVLDGTVKNVTITGSGFPSLVTVKIGRTITPIISRTDTQVVVSVDTAAVIKNERFRNTGSKYITPTLSASGYTSTNAPSLLVNYTKP